MTDSQLDDACSKCTFLSYLIAFYQQFKQARFKLALSAFANYMPEEFAREIATKYAAKSGKAYASHFLKFCSYFCRYTLPEVNMKRLIHHILILALNITHFEIDFQRAAKDLLITTPVYASLRFNLTNRCQKHISSIGAKIKTVKEKDADTEQESTRKVCVLKAPLRLVAESNSKRRR